jgi:uncharacterized membrane protein YhaH (DUF805 family)
MGLGHYLFSFRGRANRAKQWALILVWIGLHIVDVIAFQVLVGFGAILDIANGKANAVQIFVSPQFRIFCLIALAIYLLSLYVTLTVTTKRLHDRNKSAWWLLIFYALPFVLGFPRLLIVLHAVADGTYLQTIQHGQALGGPIVTLLSGIGTLISLWAFVELYIFRGTVGENRYGPDPLGG